MQEPEIDNPLVPAWQLLQQDIDPAVVVQAAAAAEEQREAVYTQAEYDKLYRRYLEQKARSEALQDSFFACADVMYEMLAYINAARLFYGKEPVMASDINAIVEDNPVLNELCNDLRQASIDSGIGIVSEMAASQENLRQKVMLAWKARMHNGSERKRIKGRLFRHPKQGKRGNDEALF
ncbi:hypothetical protein [uncultured Cardiobacterium sp.]|uniref:hypothetical protein n=1 Tax=uncultured Cardiobacterium sp. TaxID=417619 RepID=UPI00260A0915|nr:hypothetical protein [uncultured Cardiobacterium sp.]